MERTFSNAMCAATVAASLALAACESTGGDISVLSGSPIAAGSTYAWNTASAPTGLTIARRVDNDIIREGITTAVDANLAARGFRLVEPSQAQYLVDYDVRVQTPTDYDSWFVRDIDYVSSTMMLDITDRSTGRPVWRATSQKRVNRRDETEEGLDVIFADMVKTLPDGSSAALLASPR